MENVWVARVWQISKVCNPLLILKSIRCWWLLGGDVESTADAVASEERHMRVPSAPSG